MMEASPDQATLPAVSLGGNPWFETKATGGFFRCCGCVGVVACVFFWPMNATIDSEVAICGVNLCVELGVLGFGPECSS